MYIRTQRALAVGVSEVDFHRDINKNIVYNEEVIENKDMKTIGKTEKYVFADRFYIDIRRNEE